MKDWKEYKLGDVAEIIDCEHKTAPIVERSNFLSIRTTDIKNGKINFQNANRVSEQTYIEWTKRKRPQAGDIIFAREAPVGEVGWIDEKHRICLGQRTVLLRADNIKIDSRYLLYKLVNNETKFDLINQSSGSVVAHLNVKNIRDFNLIIHPNITEQRAIAAILSSLDDKIDLLHRQNKTLEAMAETLFRQWFVNNDELRMQNDEWKIGKLGDIATFYNGKSRPTDIGTVPIYGGNGILGYANTSNYSGKSIIIGRVGAYCGSLYFEKRDIWISDNALLVKANNEKQTFFLLYLLKSLELNSMAEGSSHPLLTQTLLKSIEISIPPDKQIELFDNQLNLWTNKIEANNNQIRTLEKLRDNLLPKLMSGEVRVAV